MSVSTRQEIETAARINSAGFIAHCPVYQKKYRTGLRARVFLRTKIEPLFPGYLFVRSDAAFTKDLFETSKVRLMVFRKQLLTEQQMAVINSTALDLTLAQSKAGGVLPIKRGAVMQILHGAMQGDSVEVLEAKKDSLLIRWKERPGWRDVWINASSLGRAV